MKHTMRPLYGRFLEKPRRQQFLPSGPKPAYIFHGVQKADAFFRYCPICTAQDRAQHGETYWHRMHQIIGINVCAVHGCQLLSTTVRLHNFNKRVLVAAEEVVPANLASTTHGNSIEWQLAKYVAALLHAPINLDSSISISNYLVAHIPASYMNGKMRKLSSLLADYQCYYTACDVPLMNYWQLVSVFSGRRHNPVDISTLAMFLNISVTALSGLLQT